MALYFTLINYTDQGIKDMKGASGRVAAAREAVESAGGKFLHYHLTMGQYDAVAISEAPDDATYASIMLTIAAQGNIRTTTLKGFTEEETFRILDNLP